MERKTYNDVYSGFYIVDLLKHHFLWIEINLVLYSCKWYYSLTLMTCWHLGQSHFHATPCFLQFTDTHKAALIVVNAYVYNKRKKVLWFEINLKLCGYKVGEIP